MSILQKIAYNGFISSDEFTNGERYEPTEQDWNNVHQEPFISLIQPVKDKVDETIKKGIKDIISSKFRHYIHKNRNKSNEELYHFVFDNIPYGYIWSNEIYNMEYNYIDQFMYMCSPEQVKYEFELYIKDNFTDYIKSLIDLYKNEPIYDNEQQQDNEIYNNNIYIRRPDQLLHLIDDVGDTIQLDNSFNINYKCRDSAFIFVINKAYIGDSHYNLMQKYLTKHNINNQYYFDFENITKNKIPYSYGHIYRGRALINAVYNTTAKEVKNALLEKGKYKVYDYNTKKSTLYRLAKKFFNKKEI